MTSPAQYASLRRQWHAARDRSARAAHLGDRAGSIIAAGDARNVLDRLNAATVATVADMIERTAR